MLKPIASKTLWIYILISAISLICIAIPVNLSINRQAKGEIQNSQSSPEFVLNAGGTPSIQEGPLSQRPSPKIEGRLFLNTDNNILYRDTGTKWVTLQLGPRGPKGPVGSQGPQGANGSSVLSGSGPPPPGLGAIGDTYIDTTTGEVYQKVAAPVPPNIRAIPAPSGATLTVGTGQMFATIDAAIAAANNGDRILLTAETFTISSTINVNKSITIEGQGMALLMLPTARRAMVIATF